MFSLNKLAQEFIDSDWDSCERFNVRRFETGNGATIFDCGVDTRGGIEAGLKLSQICMACLATVDVVRSDFQIGNQVSSSIQVVTDQPAWSCMASQYAGWPVSVEKYFAMGSGPMRLNRGREEVLAKYLKRLKSATWLESLRLIQFPMKR